MSKKVTMREIASHAGVSQSTVSLVLNGSTSVILAEATRMKVLQVADQLGYRRKSVAHALGRPKKVAMVINGLSSYDPFIDAINSAREEAWSHDFLLSTFNYSHDKVLASKIEAEINSGDYEGLIYASSMTRYIDSQSVQTSLPTVFLNCSHTKDNASPSILPADMVGAYKAVNHLTEQGYRRIAILSGEAWMLASQQRKEGYHQALIDADLIPSPQLVKEANWSLKEAYEQTLELMAQKQRPDAIFCCSDYMAMGCYQAIAELGLTIPQDVAVVGYDNQQIASECFPALTSLELPYADMGKLAVESLMALIESQPLLSNKRKVEGELMIRASSQKESV